MAEASHSIRSSSSNEFPRSFGQKRKCDEEYGDDRKRANQEIVVIEGDRVILRRMHSLAEDQGNLRTYFKDLPMDIRHFMAFCQCSIKMEAKRFLDCDSVVLKDSLANQMWPQFEKMAVRNSSGKMDKWVPFHTVLGPHAQFVVKNIYGRKEKTWTAARCFVLHFIFRAHCKPHVFEAQLPILTSRGFWQNPVGGFKLNSCMHKALRKFRAKGNALQTSAFRIIPEHIVKDPDENLIRNLLLRSQRLVGLAQQLRPMVMNTKTTASQKYVSIMKAMKEVHGLGSTWVKMLMVEVDIAIPSIGLLQDRCEVGLGAEGPLKNILQNEGVATTDSQTLPDKLIQLRNRIDKYIGTASGKHFENLLCKFESEARKRFKSSPMMLQQMRTSERPMSCSTLQVQLCEFRQLHEYMHESS